MFANVSCTSILVGMSSAMETLGAQNNGAENYKEVGITLQRSCLILETLVIPIFFMWSFVDQFFLTIGVDESVCAVIKSFLSIRCLSIPMQPINESYEKYLMSVGVAFPGLCGSITFNLTLLVLDIIFVFYCRYGYECLAWSYVIAYYSAVTVEISIRYLLSAFKDPFFLSLFTISRSIYFHDFEHKNITT